MPAAPILRPYALEMCPVAKPKAPIGELARFGDWFVANDWPDANCPACGVGHLRADPAVEVEATSSREARGHEAWEAEWVHGLFTCILRCQRGQCGELVVATGDWRVREYIGGDWESLEWEHQYRLRTTLPAVPIIPSARLCPDPVQAALAKASQVIWVDPSGAGNRLRVAVELSLDAKKIPRMTSGPKRTRLSTHARIDLLRLKNPDAASLLEAVKWVGNQGSHEDSLTIADVLGAAKILDVALGLLFDPHTEQVRRLARDIIKAKRIPRRRV